MIKKFSIQDKKNLTEIYRRMCQCLHPNYKPEFYASGTPFQMKRLVQFGILEPAFEEIKGMHGWYNITDKGNKLFPASRLLSGKENIDMFEGKHIMDFDFNLIKE